MYRYVRFGRDTTEENVSHLKREDLINVQVELRAALLGLSLSMDPNFFILKE